MIAGEGFKPNSKYSDIIYKNWWMTREEMISEVSSSDLVVFPYIEASQSGTIPICMSVGIPVVVTPVGGLPEQVIPGVNGFIATDVLPVSLKEAIETIISSPEFNTRQPFLGLKGNPLPACLRV